MENSIKSAITGLAVATWATTALGVVAPPAGYIYSTQILGSDTQGCVASVPGGTFVGLGPAFTANAQSIVFVTESANLRLVASGFNSIGDCAYDAASDTLYVTDNASDDDLGGAGAALSGDTVFAIPAASRASGLSAPALELLPATSVPNASSVAVDASGTVFVSDSTGGGGGSVLEIVGATSSTFLAGFDFAAGMAFDPATADLFVAQSLATFDARIDRFTAAGAPVPPAPFAGPGFDFGSYDLAFDKDGHLLVTGAFGGDIVSFDPASGASAPFVGGLTFANGIDVDPTTGRISVLSSTFAGAEEDRSLHRFTPIDTLVPGKGPAKFECVHELYGVVASDGKKATCTDGDACDADGTVNDRCQFPVGFCFNVEDGRFPDCAGNHSLDSVQISSVPYSTAIADVGTEIAAALPLAGPACFFSDGVVVPVKVTRSGVKKSGKGNVKVKARTDGPQKDRDAYLLTCEPAL
jgi:hypothetical protein